MWGGGWCALWCVWSLGVVVLFVGGAGGGVGVVGGGRVGGWGACLCVWGGGGVGGGGGVWVWWVGGVVGGWGGGCGLGFDLRMIELYPPPQRALGRWFTWKENDKPPAFIRNDLPFCGACWRRFSAPSCLPPTHGQPLSAVA